jgi:hypothetical protein
MQMHELSVLAAMSWVGRCFVSLSSLYINWLRGHHLTYVPLKMVGLPLQVDLFLFMFAASPVSLTR